MIDPGQANPRLILAIQRVVDEAEQHRILERALAEATPAERASRGVPPTPHDAKERMRGLPIIARGVGGTQVGTDPLGETIRREKRRRRTQSRGAA